MDIECPKCSTEYSLDPNKIAGDVVSLKCSECGNSFYHEFQATEKKTTMDELLQKDWMIRHNDTGKHSYFKDLVTLREWVIERKVSKNDEISKTGQKWKLLGNISELTPFFEVQTSVPPPVSGKSGFSENKSLGTVPAIPKTLPDLDVPVEHFAPKFEANLNASSSFIQEKKLPRVNLKEPSTVSDVPFVHQAHKKNHHFILWFGVFLMLSAGGILAYMNFEQIQFSFERLSKTFFTKPVSESAIRDVSQGYVFSIQDTFEGFKKANQKYDSALKASKDYDAALANKLELLTFWAFDLKYIEGMNHQKNNDETMVKTEQENVKKVVSEALEHHTGSLLLNRAMALYYYHSGEVGKADNSLNQIAAEYKNDSSLYSIQGLIASNDQTAISFFEKAVQYEPEKIRNNVELAKIYLKTPNAENIQKAKLHLQKVLQKSPDHLIAKMLLEKTLLLEKEIQEKSVQPIAEIESINKPKAPPSISQMLKQAESFREKGQVNKALELYEQVTEADSFNIIGITGMAWCYIDLDKLGAAIAQFQRAITANPQHADAFLGLAEAFRYKGNKELAIINYRKFLQLNPNGPESEVAKNAIKNLE